jgi:hypothetical protein
MRKFSAVACLLVLTAVGWTAQRAYQTGKLLDVTSQPYTKEIPNLNAPGSNIPVQMHENNLSVQVGDVIYVGQCEEKPHFSSCRPGNWIVGDPVEVRFEKDSMYIKIGTGGELKTQIVKRARAN